MYPGRFSAPLYTSISPSPSLSNTSRSRPNSAVVQEHHQQQQFSSRPSSSSYAAAAAAAHQQSSRPSTTATFRPPQPPSSASSSTTKKHLNNTTPTPGLAGRPPSSSSSSATARPTTSSASSTRQQQQQSKADSEASARIAAAAALGFTTGGTSATTTATSSVLFPMAPTNCYDDSTGRRSAADERAGSTENADDAYDGVGVVVGETGTNRPNHFRQMMRPSSVASLSTTVSSSSSLSRVGTANTAVARQLSGTSSSSRSRGQQKQQRHPTLSATTSSSSPRGASSSSAGAAANHYPSVIVVARDDFSNQQPLAEPPLPHLNENSSARDVATVMKKVSTQALVEGVIAVLLEDPPSLLRAPITMLDEEYRKQLATAARKRFHKGGVLPSRQALSAVDAEDDFVLQQMQNADKTWNRNPNTKKHADDEDAEDGGNSKFRAAAGDGVVDSVTATAMCASSANTRELLLDAIPSVHHHQRQQTNAGNRKSEKMRDISNNDDTDGDAVIGDALFGSKHRAKATVLADYEWQDLHAQLVSATRENLKQRNVIMALQKKCNNLTEALMVAESAAMAAYDEHYFRGGHHQHGTSTGHHGDDDGEYDDHHHLGHSHHHRDDVAGGTDEAALAEERRRRHGRGGDDEDQAIIRSGDENFDNENNDVGDLQQRRHERVVGALSPSSTTMMSGDFSSSMMMLSGSSSGMVAAAAAADGNNPAATSSNVTSPTGGGGRSHSHHHRHQQSATNNSMTLLSHENKSLRNLVQALRKRCEELESMLGIGEVFCERRLEHKISNMVRDNEYLIGVSTSLAQELLDKLDPQAAAAACGDGADDEKNQQQGSSEGKGCIKTA